LEENFVKICKLKDLKENHGQRFIVDEKEIAVFKVENEIYALNNICPHQHSALLYDGFIENGYVICPAHGWSFNLKNGKQPTGSRGVDSYEVEILDDDVYVKITHKDLNW
jgi:NAD(P)H-dependent nitrite reductase small subunit